MEKRNIIVSVLITAAVLSLIALIGSWEFTTLLCAWLIAAGVGFLLALRSLRFWSRKWFIALIMAILCLAAALASLADSVLALGNTPLLQNPDDNEFVLAQLTFWILTAAGVAGIVYGAIRFKKDKFGGSLIIIICVLDLVALFGWILPKVLNPLP